MPSDRKKSGNPAKAAKKVTSAGEWKKASATVDLELPSGNVCRLKRPGLPQLLEAKVLPDMLTPIAQAAIERGKNGGVNPEEQDAEVDKVMSKEGGIEALMESTARVTAYCVVEPKVAYHKRKKAAGQLDQIQESYVPEWEIIPNDERDEEILYTDDIDFEDMMFIFNYVVGGSADLVQFRRELNAAMGSVADEPRTQEDAS